MSVLIALFTTQRAGSTFLETSVTSLGGMGKLGEHFAQSFVDEVLGRAERSPLGTEDFRVFLRRGTDATGATGLTIMADYATFMAKMYLGEAYRVPSYDLPAVQRFWAELTGEFDRVFCIHLTRDPLDQAISRYFSHVTRLNHVIEGKEQHHLAATGLTHADALAGLDPKALLRDFSLIEHQQRFLDGFFSLSGQDALDITYDELCEDYQGVAGRIMEHSDGLAQKDQFQLTTQKVVGSHYVDEAIQKLADFLGVSSTVGSGRAQLLERARDYVRTGPA